MATLIENANALKAVFMDIKNAIRGKGVTIPNGTPVTEYADLIINIQTGVMQDKTITENGVYTSDYPYYGLGTVTVDTTDALIGKATRLMGMFSHATDIPFTEINIQNAWNIAYMFQCCSTLQSMTINGNAIHNGSYAFANCPSIKNVTFNCDVFSELPNNLIQNSNDNVSVASVEYMFRNSALNVSSLNVHFKYKPWLAHMFGECNAQAINVTTDFIVTDNGVNALSAFLNSKNLKTVTLSGMKLKYLWATFENCSNLTTIDTLDTDLCTSIAYAFNHCSSLETITLTSLKNLKVPTSLDYIKYVFQDCTALKNFTINDTDTTVVSIDLHYSPNLTVKSILSVFNSLEDRHENPQSSTSAVTGVVTLGDTNKNKLTTEQKLIATSKGWLLV